MADGWDQFPDATPAPAGAPASSASASGWDQFPDAPGDAAAPEEGGIISNLKAGAKLAGRTAIRVGGGLVDLGPTASYLLEQGGRSALNYLSPGIVGDTAKAPPSVTQGLLDKAGDTLAMDPNAGALMRIADYAAPFMVPGVGEVGGATTTLGRVGAVARGLIRGGADAALSYAGQQGAEALGGGEAAQQLGGLLGGSLRSGAGALGNAAMRRAFASPDAGAIYDASTSPQGPGVIPTFGMVSNTEGKNLEKAINATPIVNWFSARARQRVQDAIQQSVERNTGQLGGTGGPGPVPTADIGQNLLGAATQQHLDLQAQNSARQQALEAAVGSDTLIPNTNTSGTLTQLVGDTGVGTDAERILGGRLDSLRHMQDKANPQGTHAMAQANAQAIANANAQNAAATANYNNTTLPAARAAYAQAQAAAAGPVILKGKAATSYLAALGNQVSPNPGPGQISPAQFYAINQGLLKNKQLVVNPTDPLYSTVQPAGPGPFVPPPQPTPMQAPQPISAPNTTTYRGLREFRGETRERSSGMDAVPGRYVGQVEDAATQDMREAHVAINNAPEFDAASQAYAHMKNTQHPFIETLTGQPTPMGAFPDARPAGTVAGRVATGMRSDPQFLSDAANNIGVQPTTRAVADTVANLGYSGENSATLSRDFRPERFAVGFGKVDQPNNVARSLLQNADPTALQGLRDTATAARAYGMPPSNDGLSRAVGGQLLMDRLLRGVVGHTAKAALLSALAGQRMQSPGMIRMMAGRAPQQTARNIATTIMRSGASAALNGHGGNP